MLRVPNTVEPADWIRTDEKKILILGNCQIKCINFGLALRKFQQFKLLPPREHCLFYYRELYKICESETFLPRGLKAASSKDAFKKKKLVPLGAILDQSLWRPTRDVGREHLNRYVPSACAQGFSEKFVFSLFRKHLKSFEPLRYVE